VMFCGGGRDNATIIAPTNMNIRQHVLEPRPGVTGVLDCSVGSFENADKSWDYAR